LTSLSILLFLSPDSLHSHSSRPVRTFFSFLSPPTATPETYTLSLHDALPICAFTVIAVNVPRNLFNTRFASASPSTSSAIIKIRSEEHTSELQSRFDLVCRLLLEKKKKTT